MIKVNKDYVFVEKVHMITHNGVFLGTPNYLFCIPYKTSEHQLGKIITTKFSFKGKEIHEAIKDIIKDANTKENLENTMLEVMSEFPEGAHYKLDEIDMFKVQAGLIGSGIHIRKPGKKLMTPFIQGLGKQKKDIKAFYENHPKIK